MGGMSMRPARGRRTLEQRIAAKEDELRRLKAQARDEERKARTKRLIETGAVVEKALGTQFTDTRDRERLERTLTVARRQSDGSTVTWAELIARDIERERG